MITKMIPLKALFLLFMIFAFTINAVGQKHNADHAVKFDEFSECYRKGKLNDTTYLKKLDSLSSSLINQGVFFDVGTLANKMKLYFDVAWSNDSFSSYRLNYYLILLNNAHLSDLRGASIYYSEKVKMQAQKNGKPRPTIELSVKTQIFSLQQRFNKTIEIYQKEKQYFTDLIYKLQKHPDDHFFEGLDALALLNDVFNAYATQQDTLNIETIYKLEKSMIAEMSRSTSISKANQDLIDFSSLTSDFYKHSFYSNFEEALKVLDRLQAMKNANPGSLGFVERSLLEWKTSLFLEMKNMDSADYYLKKYDKLPVYSQNQKTLIYGYWSKLETLRKNYASANVWLSKALEESQSVKRDLSIEMDDLLYAYTESEHHRLAFEKSEKEKRIRTRWIFGIVLFSFLKIILVYIYMRRRNLKAKQIIQALNDAANLQITIMEDFANEVRKEEQKRLSQNLHDDLAGTLAVLKNRAELLMLDNKDEKQTSHILQLRSLLSDVFHNIRSKSHSLFETANLASEEMFKRHVANLAEIAFPSPPYQFTIEMDKHAMSDTSLEMRSHLIRIIQEAFTNIVKHAKATQVEITIFREEDVLLVFIKDNGIGMKRGGKKTLGMNNMRERLKQFKGTITIEDDRAGVEIKISIPILKSGSAKAAFIEELI